MAGGFVTIRGALGGCEFVYTFMADTSMDLDHLCTSIQYLNSPCIFTHNHHSSSAKNQHLLFLLLQIPSPLSNPRGRISQCGSPRLRLWHIAATTSSETMPPPLDPPRQQTCQDLRCLMSLRL